MLKSEVSKSFLTRLLFVNACVVIPVFFIGFYKPEVLPNLFRKKDSVIYQVVICGKCKCDRPASRIIIVLNFVRIWNQILLASKKARLDLIFYQHYGQITSCVTTWFQSQDIKKLENIGEMLSAVFKTYEKKRSNHCFSVHVCLGFIISV